MQPAIVRRVARAIAPTLVGVVAGLLRCLRGRRPLIGVVWLRRRGSATGRGTDDASVLSAGHDGIPGTRARSRATSRAGSR